MLRKSKKTKGWILRAYKTLGFTEHDIPHHHKEIPDIDPAAVELGDSLEDSSFGAVFIGTWKKMRVAVKKVKPLVSDSADLAPRSSNFYYTIEKEAFTRINASDDENKAYIVKLHACIDESLWFVMEYAPYGSLAKLIDNDNDSQSSPLNWEICQTILLDVAKAICFLHKIGIVHSDIKSPNILIFNDWRAKVCDFGLATMVDGKEDYRFIGSPEYMAPEIIKRKPSSKKSDVFSYAQVAWELSALEMPFYDLEGSVYPVIKAGLFDPIPAGTPKLFKEIINEGRKMNPDHRPDMETVVEMLTSSPPLKTETPRIRLSSRNNQG